MWSKFIRILVAESFRSSTVILQFAFFPLQTAVIVAFPAPFAITLPPETVATDFLLLDHVILPLAFFVSIFLVFPFSKKTEVVFNLNGATLCAGLLAA